MANKKRKQESNGETMARVSTEMAQSRTTKSVREQEERSNSRVTPTSVRMSKQIHRRVKKSSLSNQVY